MENKVINRINGSVLMHGGWEAPAACRLKTAYQRRNILKRIRAHFRNKTTIRVLEIGPGLGCLVDLIKSLWPDADYHVADVNAAVLDALLARHPNLTAHKVECIKDLERLDGQFDVIVAVDVWEHLSLQMALQYTSWCWERLEWGGLFLLQTPNWGCPVSPSTFYSDLTHCSPFNELSIAQLFKSAGIPGDAFSVNARKTPGITGAVRDFLNTFFGLFYRLVFIFFGAVRLRIYSSDLIAEACKPQRS